MNQKREKLVKPDEYWRESLSEEEYRVCRQQGTEAPFSGKLLHNKETGSIHVPVAIVHYFIQTTNMTRGADGLVLMPLLMIRLFAI